MLPQSWSLLKGFEVLHSLSSLKTVANVVIFCVEKLDFFYWFNFLFFNKNNNVCTTYFLIILLLLLLSMLLISRSKSLWKILMFNWLTVVSILFDLQLPPLDPNIFSCFSSHLRAVFFFFLLLSLPSTVLQ